ncbi:HPP family protein [Novosphingobium aquae]|uniref:HPP family protein n=1 Tax=Novosphingobium aquae TaxID=3133435 RepID=A0ABU8S8M2_9SPHN
MDRSVQSNFPHGARATPQAMAAGGRLGWLPGAVGAFLALTLTGLVSHAVVLGDPAIPWLLAPMGASAVLVFILPASPLAQPWPVLGGHMVAAAIGLLCHALVPEPWFAASLAVGASIAVMSMARCLHAPAGGTALLTALAPPVIAAMGPRFLLLPLGLNVVLLIACAWVWHRFSGHSWPHRPAPAPIVPAWAGHIEDADLDAVLEEWDEVLDVGREDLLALIHAVEARVRARAFR